MKISIIGGSGFIGSRLSNRLTENSKDFNIVDKVDSHFYSEKRLDADVRDINSLRKTLKGAGIIINLAAEHRDDVSPKSLYDEVNVNGARNVCAVCEEYEINKIIFTSSVAVYGFAPVGTDETGEINYFNDYGRTKWEAEKVYRDWLNKDPENRSLTIIRPTVVFGERNRGNVYNLLRQIASGLFPMVGDGQNVKSMAYVENVAAFLEYSLNNGSGEYVYNYIDKPDFDMNKLVVHVKKALGKPAKTGFHWPYSLGLFGGYCFDLLTKVIRKKLPISSIRIKKFCANTMFVPGNIKNTDFTPPVSIEEGLARTVKFEFIDKKDEIEVLFYTE